MKSEKKTEKRRNWFKRVFILHLFVLPGVVLLILFKYIPLIGGIAMAFEDFKIGAGFFGKQKWVGFKNFAYIFSLPDFGKIVWNTFYIAVWKIVLLLVVPIAIALLLNEIAMPRTRKLLQTVMVLPHFVSWVLLAGVYKNFLSLDGFYNRVFEILGLEPRFVFGDTNLYVRFVIISETLKEFGFSCIVYLAAIAGIEQEQYEAAKLDGAGRWRMMFSITLPNISHIIILMTVLSLGNVFNAGFEQIYNTYNGAVTERGQILDTLIYTIGMASREYSLSAAMGLLKSAISAVLIGLAYYLAYKKANYVVF